MVKWTKEDGRVLEDNRDSEIQINLALSKYKSTKLVDDWLYYKQLRNFTLTCVINDKSLLCIYL